MFPFKKSQDVVVSLQAIPQASLGAPLPLIFSNEHTLILAFFTQDAAAANVDDQTKTIDQNSAATSIAVVIFNTFHAYTFGPPNSDSCAGHPLAKNGLRPYGVFRVEESSWLTSLEKMSALQANHNPKLFRDFQHFIFTFHTITFECIARDFELNIEPGPMSRLLNKLTSLIMV